MENKLMNKLDAEPAHVDEATLPYLDRANLHHFPH